MLMQNMHFTRIWTFMDYLSLVLIVTQLWNNINCQNPDYQIRTDGYVRVQRGLCALVPCTFTVPGNIILSSNTNGFWIAVRGDTIVPVASRENSIYYTYNRRFYLSGDVTRGDCSYYIEDPWSTDQGRYYFRIVDPQAQYSYLTILPYVDVTAMTDKPTISPMRLVDGKEVTMTCTSPGRCRNIAQPRISWEGAMAGAKQVIYIRTYEDGRRTFHSNMTFTPRKTHNNSPLSCRVSFNQDLSTMEKQILNVEYSPSINITTKGIDTNDTTSVIVEDGDSVTLQCIVDSNPNASVTWYKEDTMLHRNMSNQTVTIQLINITERDAGRYQCSAMNEHGVTNRSIHIMYQSSKEEFSPVIPAAIGGVILFVLIILIGVFLFMYFRKKRQQNANKNLRDASVNQINDTYSYAEFTTPDVSPPEKTLQKEVNAGDDSIYVNSDDLQYSSIEFSKFKPKDIQDKEDIETQYSEIRKAPQK